MVWDHTYLSTWLFPWAEIPTYEGANGIAIETGQHWNDQITASIGLEKGVLRTHGTDSSTRQDQYQSTHIFSANCSWNIVSCMWVCSAASLGHLHGGGAGRVRPLLCLLHSLVRLPMHRNQDIPLLLEPQSRSLLPSYAHVTQSVRGITS